MECLLGGYFSVAISPHDVTVGKAPTLRRKAKPTCRHLFYQVFCIGEILCALSIFAKLSDNVRNTLNVKLDT